MGRTQITTLSAEERGRLDEWADKWIDIGLRTGPADRERFEQAARDCYRFANIEWPGVVVWVPSPLALAVAAPTAALTIQLVEAGRRGTPRLNHGAVDDAVRDAVDAAVGGAVGGTVRGAVRGAVRDAVRDAVGGAVDDAVRDVIRRGWTRRLGGQLWSSGWYWGGAWTSFFREVCGLELGGDLWARARAYEGTIESACWWWPHRRFVMVCERPTVIYRGLTNPAVERGWGSHRLHCETGPAVAWPDGWGVWAIHGIRVPQQVVERPETLTPEQILAEPNAEVRRVMIDRFGADRLIQQASAKERNHDDTGRLWELPVGGDEPLVMVELQNSSLEPDGSRRTYFLRVPPATRTAREAVAWTFDMAPGEYLLGAES